MNMYQIAIKPNGLLVGMPSIGILSLQHCMLFVPCLNALQDALRKMGNLGVFSLFRSSKCKFRYSDRNGRSLLGILGIPSIESLGVGGDNVI